MKTSTRSLALVTYFVALPYISRLGGGLDWVMQYIPSSDRLFLGLLFFAVFSAIPGVVLAAMAAGSKGEAKLPLVAAFLVASVLTIDFHRDYDLASDAQAAIGLVIWPIYVTVAAAFAYVIFLGAGWMLGRLKSRGTDSDG